MRTLLLRAAALAALLPLAGRAAADPPPPEAELRQLLAREPIDLANWSKWSPRLREWSGEHYDQAAPAFQQALGFIQRQQKVKGNRLTLPKGLDKDAVAWMLVAGVFLHDPNPPVGPVVVARQAREAAERSIRLDNQIARAHYYLCWALQQEQLTPPAKGGPNQPDKGRLRQALRELKEARALDPKGRWLTAGQAAAIARRAEQWDEAEFYLAEVLKQKPNDAVVAERLGHAVLMQNQRPGSAVAALKPLVEQFPSNGALQSQYALALHRERKTAEAAAALAKARALNYDPVQSIPASAVRQIEQQQAHDDLASAPTRFAGTVGWWALWFTIIYGIVMLLMCLGGLMLAKYTRGPRAADMLGTPPEQLAAGGQVTRTRGESRLTKFYVFALLLALVLFYLSLPFVFLGLLIVFLIVLLLTLVLRRDPDTADVHSALMRASGGGMKAVFKAMFARVGTGSFGLRKEREDCPKLWAAVAEVARRVDTDPVDEIWISPGADFGVHQEGRGPFGVFGGRKRVLTLGLCVMNYLTVSELKAILAHEYAHFSHADTFWNRFLFQVTLSLRTAMREMARTGGWVTYVNPFYWFFWLYSRSYSLLSAGFSRSREFLADRMACTLYGADIFARALRKVCTDGSHFEMTIYTNIVRLLKQDKAFVNMYLAFRKHRDEGMTDEERRKLHRKLLDDKPSVFASHPTFQERMQAAKQLPVATQSEDIASLQLFDDPEAVERELTDFLTEVVSHFMNR